jgi:hypothetical protein
MKRLNIATALTVTRVGGGLSMPIGGQSGRVFNSDVKGTRDRRSCHA